MLQKISGFLFGTLRGRLIVGVAAVHAVMMALFIGDLTARQRAMLLDRQIEGATAMAHALATSASGWIVADDIAGLQELVEVQRRYPETLFAILADEQGLVLAGTDKSKQGLYMLDLPREARQTMFSVSDSLVDVAVPAMVSGRHVGWARVGIGQKEAGKELAKITRNGVLYAIMAILSGSFVAWLLGLRITRRLYAVQKTIYAVRGGDCLARTTIAGNDEAAVMAREFNVMLDAVAARDLELRASETRYRSLIEKVQAAILLHDALGCILASNSLAQELLGLSGEFLLGKTLDDPYWHFLREDGSVMPVAEYPVSVVLATGQPLRDRVAGISCPDREYVSWVLVNAEPEYENSEKVARVIVSFVDITERKRGEEASRKAGAYTRSLIEASLDPLVTIGPDGRITDVNAATESVTGYSRMELVGTDFSDYFTEPEKARAGYRHVFQEGLVRDYPLEIRHREGRVTAVLYNASVYRDEAGQVLGVFASARDITERQRAEAKERLLSAIVESSNDAIIAKTLDGVILSWNRGAESVYGYCAAETIGRSVSMLFPADHPDELTEIKTHIARGERIEHYTTERVRKDGKRITIALTISPIWDGAGTIVGASSIAHDVTERERAEQALKLSEDRLRKAQRLARIGSWELDLVTNNLIWSDEIYRIFEISPEQFGASYDAFLELIHPDDRATVNTAYTDSVRNRNLYAIDHRLQFPDGRFKYVIEQCETFYAADGRPLRSIGTVQDITERKLAEEALQRLNRELRAISNCNQVVVRAADEKTLLNDICRIVCDEAGYRMAWVGYAESNADKTILPVAWAGAEDGYLADIDITWDDTDRGRGPSGTAIRSGQTSCIQDFVTEPVAAPWRGRALQHGYRSSIALPLKDESGHAFGVLNIYSAEPDSFSPDEIRLLEELSGDLAFGIMVLRGRAEQKRAEEELVKSEASLRTLIQTIPDLIWLKNAAGVYLSCNSMFERFFGAREADILGKTDYDFVDRELADSFREHDRKAMAAGKPSSNEEWITFADDGHRALLDTTMTPMYDAAGNLIGVLGIGHDITERRSLENQLRQAQKLEAIGTLTGGVAHDFNNILSVIIGFGSILEMKMATDDPLLDNVTQILTAADRAAKLTRSMLAFSRKQALEVKPENMNEIIAAMEKMIRRLIREDIELQISLTGEALPVLADAGQLEQVLLNLTTNAKDSMPNGGTITITTGQAELDDSFRSAHGYGEPGSYALISFIDSGAGMDADVRQRIFEPFFTTKEVGKGTGLGLAVCYGIIKQHGGYIVCYSEPGKGTSFRIYLPLNRDATTAKAAATESPPPRGGTETILVAEDDAAVRELTTSILKEFGYAIIEAEDGAEAVAQFARHGEEIQLCLFDMIMPKRNGMSAYEEIKKVRPDIRVLFMSGYQADAAYAGVQLILKPVLPRELLQRVRELLDQSS